MLNMSMIYLEKKEILGLHELLSGRTWRLHMARPQSINKLGVKNLGSRLISFHGQICGQNVVMLVDTKCSGVTKVNCWGRCWDAS